MQTCANLAILETGMNRLGPGTTGGNGDPVASKGADRLYYSKLCSILRDDDADKGSRKRLQVATIPNAD